jgi:micrococcal nuclease
VNGKGSGRRGITPVERLRFEAEYDHIFRKEPIMPLTFTYPFTLVRIMDGDTVEGDVDLGFFLSRRVTVRINGINAPEKVGAEKEAGLLVKQCMDLWFNLRKGKLELVSKELDKYGRVLGEIQGPPGPSNQPDHLSQWLMTAGLVKAYDGGTREPYSAAQLKSVIVAAKQMLGAAAK